MLGSSETKRIPSRNNRAASVALAIGLSLASTGCSHIGSLFEDPAPQTTQKPAPRKPAPAKAVVVVTPEQRAEAKSLHASAMTQMSRGAFGPAASNLQRAAKLDPTNEQIRRDLVRANRIRTAIASGDVPARHGIND